MAKANYKSAVHLIIRKKGKLLFQLRENTDFADDTWQLPAGHVEFGESIIDAAIREAHEELGISVTEAKIMSCIHRNVASGGYVDYLVDVVNFDGEVCNSEPNKCGGLKYIGWTNKEIYPQILPYIKKALKEIALGNYFIEYNESVFNFFPPINQSTFERVIACDFDGTLCEIAWPNIGAPKEEIIAKLKEEQKNGAKAILWTCREGSELQNAIDWCAERDIFFDAINESLSTWIAHFGGETRKIGATEYWDDKAFRIE